MGIFTGTTNGRETSHAHRAPSRGDQGGGGGGLSIVAPDLVITGELAADGVIKVEGRVQGTVRAGHQVLVSPGAVVEGDIETREAIIGGIVRGNIRATDRVELQTSCEVHGDIRTARLLIHEGGVVNGEVRMEEETRVEPGESR
jgi:cytoskeletal protein CcmA (bactofilin family)